MKYNSFHATLSDLTPRLHKIETQFDLKYIPVGWQNDAIGDIFPSVFAISDLGTAKSDRYSLNDGFLVGPKETEFVIRAIPQHAGGIQYLVDPVPNPGTFLFSPGGMSGSDRLIGGSICHHSTDPSIRKLCFRFSHLLLKGFEKVLDAFHDPWWVGPEAMLLLRSGCTLVTDQYWPLALPVDRQIEVEGVRVRVRQTWDLEATQTATEAEGNTMWEQWTVHSRNSIMAAAKIAAQSHQKQVTTEHLLLGLLAEGTIALRFLKRLKVDPEQVRSEIAASRVLDTYDPDRVATEVPTPDQQEFSPTVQRVFELAQDEAAQNNSRAVEEVFLLIGLLREESSPASQILTHLGAGVEQVREALRLLHDPDNKEPFLPPDPADEMTEENIEKT